MLLNTLIVISEMNPGENGNNAEGSNSEGRQVEGIANDHEGIAHGGGGGIFHRMLSGIRGIVSSRPPAQVSFIDMDPTEESSEILYRQVVTRTTSDPHTIKYRDPSHIITGVSCRPRDVNTNSAETEIIEGGVGSKHVTLRLTPVQRGEWACLIEIQGVLEN